jgi:hypothetical protein
LGLGDRGRKQPLDGLQPRLGGVEVAAAQLQRGPAEEQVDRGGVGCGDLQALAGDLFGLVPAAEGEQRLGGVVASSGP